MSTHSHAGMPAWITTAAVSLLCLGASTARSQIIDLGPDTFGYLATEIPYHLRDIRASGAPILVFNDDAVRRLELPFEFEFYGLTHNRVFVSSNGFLSFDDTPDPGCCEGQPLPAPDALNNLVSGFWEDLDPGETPRSIRYTTLGAPGQRQLVVGFYDVPHYPAGTPVTFEMILHEQGSAIEFQYRDAGTDGGPHSVGIENPEGTSGIQLAFGPEVSFNRRGILVSAISPHDQFRIRSVDLRYQTGSEPNDGLTATGFFRLSSGTDGIDPVTEPVIVTLGGSVVIIPVGGFSNTFPEFTFGGSIDGLRVNVTLTEREPGGYYFEVAIRGDLSNTPNPVPVGIRIGNDQGEGRVRVDGRMEYRSTDLAD